MNDKLGKIRKDSTFWKLTKPQQKAIQWLFQGKTQKYVSQQLNVDKNTITNWKNNEKFQNAQADYAISRIQPLLNDAVQQTAKMLKSNKTPAMVKFQIIQMLFKQANLLSDNSTPELDKAKIRKANADARVAEARAKAMEDNGQDMEQLLDKMLDTLTKEDEKNVDK